MRKKIMALVTMTFVALSAVAVSSPVVIMDGEAVDGGAVDFFGDSCEVSISCATYGATIYYGLNAAPRPIDRYMYSGPFSISESTVIYAIAKVGDTVSDPATRVTVTKRTLSLGEASGGDAEASGWSWTTGGDADWIPIRDISSESGYSVQSGVMGDAAYGDVNETWVETIASGRGTLSFKWRVDCEEDYTGDATWDHVAFSTNGAEMARMDGDSGWQEFSITFTDDAPHTNRWTFIKDDYNEENFIDCAWLSGVTWTPSRTYMVRFNANGGEGTMESVDFVYGSSTRLPENEFTCEHRAFTGWNTEPDGSGEAFADGAVGALIDAADGDVVMLYAQWRPNRYVVRFDAHGGEGAMEDQVFEYGYRQRLSRNAFTRAGYGFGSWNTKRDGTGTSYADLAPVENLTSDDGVTVDLYAQWRPNRYVVRFNANGGYGTMADQEFEYGYMQRLTKNAYTRAGYMFWRWNDKRDGSGDAYDDGEQVLNLTDEDGVTVELYAQWAAPNYTVHFDGNGGELPAGETMDDMLFTYGGSAWLPENKYVNASKTFTGWNTMPDGSGTHYDDGAVGALIDAAEGETVTLYAQWRPNRYTVRFNANGGEGTMADQEFEYGYKQRLTRNAYRRSGYGFRSWNTKRDGTGTSYADQAPVQDLTGEDGVTVELYAQWAAANYTVHFEKNAEDAVGTMNSMNFTYGRSARLPENKYVNASKTFTGWNTEPDGSGTHYDDGAVGSLIDAAEGETVTLYAQWRPNTYTVRFNASGGTGTMADQEFDVGVAQRLNKNEFTLDGKEFLGWTNRVDGSFYVDRQTVKDISTEDGAVVRLYAMWSIDVMPEVASDSEVVATMSESVDERLSDNVKTVSEYNALRDWADANGINHLAVMDSAHSWESYLLGAERLLENAPTIELGGLEIGRDEPSGMEEPKDAITISVTIKDGNDTVACAVEKVAAMFEATSALDDWDGAAKLTPTVESLGVTDGVMRFRVTPGTSAPNAFLRIREK